MGKASDVTKPYLKHQGHSIPWLEPAAAVLGSKWAQTQPLAAVASVAALVEGGWWPQERLYRKKLSAESICRARGAAVATLLHRSVHCSARKEQREEQCPKWLLIKRTSIQRIHSFKLGCLDGPFAPLHQRRLRDG